MGLRNSRGTIMPVSLIRFGSESRPRISVCTSSRIGAIERYIRKFVGLAILFARHVFDGEIGEALGQLTRAFMQGPQIGAFDLVTALHLPHQQLRVAAHKQAADALRGSVI